MLLQEVKFVMKIERNLLSTSMLDQIHLTQPRF